MIVLTSIGNKIFNCTKGDRFRLTISDSTGCDVVIDEEITENKIIDYIATYRFAMEDGRCPGFHLCGIFGNRNELPKEIIEAIPFNDLTRKQKENFKKTCSIKIFDNIVNHFGD